MKPIFLLFVFLWTIVSLSSCQSDNYLQPKLKNTYWQASEFLVVAPSFRGSDSTYRLQADASNWEKILQGQPSTIELKEDGSFAEEHFNSSNALILSYQGKWSVAGDSLFFDVEKPLKTKFKYLVDIDETSNKLKLSKHFDYDNDKQVDDHQEVVYKKQ